MSSASPQRVARSRLDYQSPAFLVPEISLHFDLVPGATRVKAKMQLQQQRAGAALELDGQQLKLISVAIDGQALTPEQYQLTPDGLRIDKVPQLFELSIETEIAPIENTALEGLYMAGNTYCTQCEAEGFRRIMYFPDRPDVLSRYTVTITADAQQYPYLLSNGNKLEDYTDHNGKHCVVWQDPFPKPCYLFALVGGDFDVLRDNFVTQSGRDVTLELFVDKGAMSKGGFAIEALKRAMRWDEQRFGLEYDLDIYMVVAVDFFNMGAMENKGLNIFNSKYVLADAACATDRDYFNIESIIGHEYFHNWTGNRVTCRDWFQLSLKEGLTVFRDQEFSADMGSETLCRIDAVKLIRTAQFAEDASPMSHPIRPEQVLEMNNFYTVTVYDKGAEVIRMLQTLLGRQQFAEGLALYLKQHDGEAATCDDFISAMQQASGYDLSAFARWYSQSGTPQLSVSQQYDGALKQLTLSMKQHTPATADQVNKAPLVIPVSVELLFRSGDRQQQLLTLTTAEQHVVLDNIAAEPVVVWLQQFSAPVKLSQQVPDEDLLFIAKHASDGVARWDAMQHLWGRAIHRLIGGAVITDVITEPVLALYRNWLSEPGSDIALTAELMTLPDFDTLAEQYDEVPVDGILQALKQCKAYLALQLTACWHSCLSALPVKPYQYCETDAAERRLKALCLQYLALVADSETLLAGYYQQSDNMTDTVAVLTACQQAGLPLFNQLMADFCQRWQHDVQVMDKAFALIATQPTDTVFSAMSELHQHKLYSWTNPNRVRAIYSSFSMRNPAQFHRDDGAGYQLLQKIVVRLDPINPQVASRLITPLLSWQRYDVKRQQLMRETLERLSKVEGLSNDVFEKISKSL